MKRPKRFPLETKIKFLDLYHQCGSAKEASQAIGVRPDITKYWVKHEQRFRSYYNQALQVQNGIPSETRRVGDSFLLAEKIQCIQALSNGISQRKAAEEFNCSKSVVQSWYAAKDELLALYYTQQGKNQEPELLSPVIEALAGVQMDTDQTKKDLTTTIKAQAQEIEYLKDRIAFLENLNTVLKERTGDVKKKKSSKLSAEVSQEEETM